MLCSLSPSLSPHSAILQGKDLRLHFRFLSLAPWLSAEPPAAPSPQPARSPPLPPGSGTHFPSGWPAGAQPFSVSPCLPPSLNLPHFTGQQIWGMLASPHLRPRLSPLRARGERLQVRVLGPRAWLPVPPAAASFASCRVKALLSRFPASPPFSPPLDLRNK